MHLLWCAGATILHIDMLFRKFCGQLYACNCQDLVHTVLCSEKYARTHVNTGANGYVCIAAGSFLYCMSMGKITLQLMLPDVIAMGYLTLFYLNMQPCVRSLNHM